MTCPTCQTCSMEPLAFCWWCPNCGTKVSNTGKVTVPAERGAPLDPAKVIGNVIQIGDWQFDLANPRRLGA